MIIFRPIDFDICQIEFGSHEIQRRVIDIQVNGQRTAAKLVVLLGEDATKQGLDDLQLSKARSGAEFLVLVETNIATLKGTDQIRKEGK